MKKLQLLTAMLSTAAIAGVVAFTPANAQGCPFSNLGTQSSPPTLPGSGTDKMNPWNANKGPIAFGFLAALLGTGAGYMSYRAGQEAKAACAAIADNFDLNAPEELAGDEVRQHPEAPGGELDLVVEPSLEIAVAK